MKDMVAELGKKVFNKLPSELRAGSNSAEPLMKGSTILSRRGFLAGIGAGALAMAACKNPDKGIVGPDPDHPNPTLPPSTTTEAPTTTVKVETPRDVMEVYADGSELLRNGGVLYKGEKNGLPEWFGGIEIHVIDMDGNKTGLQEGAQNTILDALFWAFGNQHPELIGPDGNVDIEAYKAYLEQNDWVDPQVFVPDNVSTGRTTGYSPVAPSSPLMLDFKKPFIIGNDDLDKIDGFKIENPNYYNTDASGQAIRTLFGISSEGQLYYSVHELNSLNEPKRLRVAWGSGINNLYMTSEQLGGVLTVTGRITYPEDSPKDQYANPFLYYYEDMWVTPRGFIAPYPILDIHRFVEIDKTANTVKEILFKPVS